ncbi:MAG: hypothetical protein GY804_12430 [Alphaproteobacteria bacterium]|nr:hypothetical protein [Alphaproteobacteria bacterium]
MFKRLASRLKHRRKQRIVIDPKKPLNRFTSRVMMVCFPTALLLLILVFAHKLEPEIAVMSFAGVVIVNVIIMLPFLYDLQRISDYAKELSLNTENDVPKIDVFDETEEVGQIVAAVTKMHSAWKNQRKELKNTTLTNAAVIDSLPDPLLIFDKEGGVVNANYAARDVFERSLKGMFLSDFLSKKQILDLALSVFNDNAVRQEDADLLNFIPSKHIKFENGNNSAAKSSELIEMNVRVEALPGRIDGKSVAVMVFHDITSIKQLEKSQSDFVANASHELRTPLSVISGAIETVQGPAKNDLKARDKFMSLMADQAVRMDLLINDLLALSRINFDKDDVFVDDVDVKHQIKRVVDVVSSNLKGKKMSIKMDFDACEDAYVRGSACEIYQVFENIISNAIKYGNVCTEITIKVSIVAKMRLGKGIQVSVCNLGDGIKEDEISRVKERFYRVDTSRNKKIMGTGLGLAIVDRILTRHQGIMDIKSNYGSDTTFTIFLPIMD